MAHIQEGHAAHERNDHSNTPLYALFFGSSSVFFFFVSRPHLISRFALLIIGTRSVYNTKRPIIIVKYRDSVEFIPCPTTRSHCAAVVQVRSRRILGKHIIIVRSYMYTRPRKMRTIRKTNCT